jgi:hypothetical protein
MEQLSAALKQKLWLGLATVTQKKAHIAQHLT